MNLSAGVIFADRYVFKRLIATGGMGEVWEAFDERLDRKVAIKVLKSEFSSSPEFLARFRSEAKTAARFKNQRIAQVFDYGEIVDESGRTICFIVMELVEGKTLSAIIVEDKIPINIALYILEQTSLALSAVHNSGLIHRDIKPGNIILTPDDEVKLTDFGIAKLENDAPLTMTGVVVGTPQYISPEQAFGNDATSASDVYALGIVGYEMLTGSRPFSGETPVAIAIKHMQVAPEPLPLSIPENVRNLIEFALVKEPEKRYRNGAEFAEAISMVRAGKSAPYPSSIADIMQQTKVQKYEDTKTSMMNSPKSESIRFTPTNDYGSGKPDLSNIGVKSKSDNLKDLTTNEMIIVGVVFGLLIVLTAIILFLMLK